MHGRNDNDREEAGKPGGGIGHGRGSIAPHAKGQRGFKSLLAFVDREDDEIVFVSLWETEEDLEAGENSGYYEEQLGKLSAVLTGHAKREAFEASVLA